MPLLTSAAYGVAGTSTCMGTMALRGCISAGLASGPWAGAGVCTDSSARGIIRQLIFTALAARQNVGKLQDRKIGASLLTSDKQFLMQKYGECHDMVLLLQRSETMT